MGETEHPIRALDLTGDRWGSICTGRIAVEDRRVRRVVAVGRTVCPPVIRVVILHTAWHDIDG